jgi:hypothetical protein
MLVLIPLILGHRMQIRVVMVATFTVKLKLVNLAEFKLTRACFYYRHYD